MIEPMNSTERMIINSPEFKRSWDYGKVRSNHPEGNVGRHIEMILDYIEKNYKNDPDYEKLRLLALLHDMGKYKNYIKPHSTNSAEIAKKFTNDKELIELILIHDYPWSFFKKWEKGEFDFSKFISTFKNTNWELLTKFRYCDNCNRSQKPSYWFEEKCHELLV